MEHSKYATQALDLSKLQEETKQKEQMVKIKEYEAHIEQVKIFFITTGVTFRERIFAFIEGIIFILGAEPSFILIQNLDTQ